MGSVDVRAPAPILGPPKKRRKPTDYGKLVLRNGRLTPSSWMLKEAFTQDLHRNWVGTRKSGSTEWRFSIRLGCLVEAGYLQQVKGPRGGEVWRTTPEGAFAMLIAEGQHEAKKGAHS